VYGDLERPPLRAQSLQRALAPDGWRVEVVATAGSTNALVADRARTGEPTGLVDRTWVSPPRAGLTFSVLVRPTLPPAQWPWLPLFTGLAVAQALRSRAGVDAVLKWPNDVLVDGRKVCGVLAEVPAPGTAVLGIGLNVSTREEELPHPGATSLALAGAATTDRDTVLRAVLRSLRRALGDPVQSRTDYSSLCDTVGRRVRVDLPDGSSREGSADRVDQDGRLVVDGTAYGAGDVVHLRPVSER
jgi:BirA family biotin operon repressor/biotin-[acetyl-CoA-carboxylase] ligase